MMDRLRGFGPGWFVNTAIWIAALLAPIKETMIAVGFLIAVDTIVGIWAAVKRGETISSGKLGRTVSKSIGYQLALIVAFVCEQYLIPELPLVRVMSGFIASVEFLSIAEKLSTITGIPIADVVKRMFDKKEPPAPPKA